MTPLSDNERAEAGRAAYEASWKTGVNGGIDEVPWEDLSIAVQEEWMTIADAVVKRQVCGSPSEKWHAEVTSEPATRAEPVDSG